MIRAVLDTNVLVSGTFWTGDSFKILNLAEGKTISIILSKEIIEEYYKACLSDEILEKQEQNRLVVLKSIAKIAMNSAIVIPKRSFKIVKDDPDDDKVIEAAVEGNADYIVSQDNHLLKLKEFKGARIVTPKEFLTILKNQ